ncbi:hypothetical protein [Vulcanisaeta souniana]|uniref:hypothetical protein n=1 Tax=Vulcanisaeta souniana TaxID=164452 RepID=UPI001E521ACD|nr:hypothetical protein [Vulcanisaeta souniana]
MRTEKLENKIREFVIRYMNPEKFGGRVFLVHGNEAREYPDPGSARSAALSLPGISIIIQVPNRDEAGQYFTIFLRLNKETHSA